MLKKNIIMGTVLLTLFLGCSSKKIDVNSFKSDIIEVNKKIEFLNEKLSSPKIVSKECIFEKENLLAIQKENTSVLDNVFKLNNLLSYTKFSFENKKEIENSLDNALIELFTLRSESKNRLLAEEYLCNLEIKPIPKIEPCTDCRAVFN